LFDIYVKISALFKPEEDAFKEATKRGEDTSELENSGLLGEVKRYFRRMEDGDEEALALWKYFRDLSIEKYKKTYARLNIYFDDYNGESQVKKESMEKAERILAEKGITETDQGAKIINFEKHGSKRLATAIVRNRNGTTNYLLRDVGSVLERWEKYKYDKSIYVIMSEQDLHVARNFKVVELLGPPYTEAAKRCLHVNYGKVSGMSTRKGTVKFLDDILEEVGAAMHDVMRKNEGKYAQVEDPAATADLLGISAVMVQDMSGKRINNYPFDIARMTSFEGDTGPYLQYAHARLCSISRKANLSPQQLEGADFGLLKEPHAVDLLRLMAQWPDTVLHTMTTLEPTTVLTYLFRMTHQLSSSYDVLRVVGAPEGEETGRARAALYEGARTVLANGMRLLGLTPVDRM
jgi:arginyl-tRNA synthetase